MIKVKNIEKKLSIVLLLAMVMLLLNSGEVWAADIFETVRAKVVTTLISVRNIAYVVGGMGLIAFTYAAIFGKISFKHLATISFSLWLLGMMGPFIRYFGNSDTLVPELTYGNYLSSDDAASDDTANGSCQTTDCPESGDDDKTYDGGELGEVVITPDKKEESALSTWQKIKNTVKTVKEEASKAYDTASTVYSAAKNTVTATKNVVNAVKNIDSVGDLLSAGTLVVSSVQNIAGNAVMVGGAIGNYADTETLKKIDDEIEALRKDSQDNPGNVDANNARITELQEQRRTSTTAAKVQSALGGVLNGASEAGEVLGDATSINNTAQASQRLGSDILSGKGLK